MPYNVTTEKGHKIDYVHNKPNGDTIYCYGDINENSNFFVECDNEYNSGHVEDVDPTKQNTWKRVCEYLLLWRSDIEQVECD